MKKVLTCTKTLIALLIVAIVFAGMYAYMLARPISYGMGYHNKTTYEGGIFEGTMKFYSDNTMANRNTNFEEDLKSRYYYKDGYVFFTLAETDEEYEKEVATINEDFDQAVNTPFYADEINAFRLIAAESDGYSTVYTCAPAILLAIIGGVLELALIALICASLILRKAR